MQCLNKKEKSIKCIYSINNRFFWIAAFCFVEKLLYGLGFFCLLSCTILIYLYNLFDCNYTIHTLLYLHSLVNDGRNLEITELVTEQPILFIWIEGQPIRVMVRIKVDSRHTSRQENNTRELTRRAQSGQKHAELIHMG